MVRFPVRLISLYEGEDLRQLLSRPASSAPALSPQRLPVPSARSQRLRASYPASANLFSRFAFGAPIPASIVLGRPATKADRLLAKAVNFGLLFGQRADGLRTYAKNTYGVDMSEDDAKQFRTTFLREYEGLAAWHAQAWRDARNPSVTEVRTRGIKRRRHLPDHSPDNLWQRFTSLVNTPVQGGCAEVGKLAMLDIDKRLGGRAGLVNCVHDELVVEVPEPDAAEVPDEVVRIMQHWFSEVFKGTPVNMETSIADSWAEKGGKKPETVALAA